jgi:uncharacterized phage protein gp47/JayE
MPWPVPDIDTLYARIIADMESRVTQGVKIPTSSSLGIMAIVFSGISRAIYEYIAWGNDQLFLDRSEQLGLVRWGNILGLPAKAPIYTTGVVYFVGTDLYPVPEGTVIVSDAGLEYETLEASVINSPPAPPVQVNVRALSYGSAYNTDASFLTLSQPSDDINSTVVVVSGFDNGQDLETDSNWQDRLLQRFQNPPASGNAGDYERWALEVAGVGKSWCIPTYVGSGTVGVLVSDSNLGDVSTSILNNVETYIETKRPVPAVVYCINVVNIDIDIDISITPNNSDIQEAITTNLNDLFLQESGPGETIYLSHIRQAIGSSGVTDYEITNIDVDTVSIGVDNITSSIPNVPLVNTISFSTLS